MGGTIPWMVPWAVEVGKGSYIATSIHRFLTIDMMQPADPNSFPTALMTCEPDCCLCQGILPWQQERKQRREPLQEGCVYLCENPFLIGRYRGHFVFHFVTNTGRDISNHSCFRQNDPPHILKNICILIQEFSLWYQPRPKELRRCEGEALEFYSIILGLGVGPSNFHLHCCRECLCLFKPRIDPEEVEACRSSEETLIRISAGRASRNEPAQWEEYTFRVRGPQEVPNKQSSQIHTCNVCDDGSCLPQCQILSLF